jgi:uncharacterized membrane protein HdeD (DUF308 family)
MYSYGVKFIELGWFSNRNLHKGLMQGLRQNQKKGSWQAMLEYLVLILLVVLLARFLNQLPLAYTMGIFFAFAGVLYGMLIIK